MGKWTRPAPTHYPHQWLWDSCFVAIGLSHLDVKRAETEINSLFRGQWSNGMIPHMVFGDQVDSKGKSFWDSKVSPFAPDRVVTSGITQPPVVAEAVVRIGSKMTEEDRKYFYKKAYPHLLAHHEWLYRERNPHAEGLVLLIHPWETGMDNSPPWMAEMEKHQKPWWIKAFDFSRADVIMQRIRGDTRQTSEEERISTRESLLLYNVVRRLRRKQYDCDQILLRSHFLIEDLFFNAILIRNNQLLQEIAREIHAEIPAETLSFMNKATKSLEDLWDEETGQYYSRNFVTRKSLKMSTIATLIPLYSGAVSKDRAQKLVDLLKDEHWFGLPWPVPSVPLRAPEFGDRKYWQGPTWINTNWLVIEGLLRYGYKEEAKKLRQGTIDLVERSGFKEYFSPVDGYGAGLEPFSWSAALTIDLLERKIQ